MRCSTRPRWTKRTKAAAITLPLIAGQGLAAEPVTIPLTEPHQDQIMPRAADQARVAMVTARGRAFDAAEAFEANSGGAATVAARADDRAFSLPSDNMARERVLEFSLGNSMFKKLWVSSPSSTKASDGLGPLYNARSCQRCHVNDGRGHVPDGADDSRVSMFLRLSVPAPDDAPFSEIEAYLAALDGDAVSARQRPVPAYGWQLQDLALTGHAVEGRMEITYEEVEIALSEGETVSLRKPSYQIANPGYGPLPKALNLSPRVANPMIGLGLLEAIPVADILAHADPEDADGDGISGRPNVVWSRRHATPMVGRFGWKAGEPTVEEQSAAAFASDIGISTPLIATPAGDCTEVQVACLAAPNGAGDVRIDEVDQGGLDLVTFYARNLAVPARRDVDAPEVLRGKAVFYDIGCAACHVPKFVTHRYEGAALAAQSFQLIWPYTDLLLHDMGEGLADHRPEGRASGREWRTPPLWGIGLTKQVSEDSSYLHDGRARTLLEAVLWHGGEAEPAREAVVAMPKSDRDALIRFLESL